MAPPKELLIDAVQHPNPKVRRVGFELDDPYVEHVWVGLIGPSATLLLRRLPGLWREASPAQVDVAELAASLGLGTRIEGWNSQIWRTLRRLADFRLSLPVDRGRIGVLAQVPPISDRQLARLPEWTGRAHDRLLGAHLGRLAREVGVPTPTSPAGTAAHITARLEHLQHQATLMPAGPTR